MNTVTAEAEIELAPWPTPDWATIVADVISVDEGAEGGLRLPIETAPQAFVDALVKRWLDNLYAGRGARSPFAHVGSI